MTFKRNYVLLLWVALSLRTLQRSMSESKYEGTFISMYNYPRLAELLCDMPPWPLAAGKREMSQDLQWKTEAARVKRSHFSQASYLYWIKRPLLRWIPLAVFCLHNNCKGRKNSHILHRQFIINKHISEQEMTQGPEQSWKEHLSNIHKYRTTQDTLLSILANKR